MKILIISPFFAPYTGVGSARMTSLSKYLSNSGVDVTVLKNANSLYPNNSCKGQVPENIVIHEINTINKESSLKKAYIQTLDKLLENNEFDLILVSGGPFYTFPAVLNAHYKYRVNYIIDFRDLCFFNYTKKTTSLRILLGKIKGYIKNLKYLIPELVTVKNAKAIVTVCTGDKAITENHHKGVKDKIHVVLNGYDDIELTKLKFDNAPTYNSFIIGHFGKLTNYSYQYAKELLLAIKQLRLEGIDIKLLHINEKEERVYKIIKEIDLDNEAYINTGLKSYSDGILMLKNVDSLSLVHVHPTGFGTKIFDYIYLNKPVVAVAPSNIFLSNFIKTYENAFVCQTKNQIVDSIKYVLNNQIKVLDNSNNYLEFSRSNQNKEFFNIIKAYI